MSKKQLGKTFSTTEEAGVTPPTEAELTRARRLFHAFQQQAEGVPESDRPTKVSPKFWDDISGTEYENTQGS